MFSGLTEIEKIAIHEAGHAMMADYLCTGRVTSISIEPAQDSLGRCEHIAYGGNKRQIKRHVILCCSGLAACILFTGDDTMLGFASDFEEAVALSKKLSPYPEDYAIRCVYEAIGMIETNRSLKNAILNLACELLVKKTITNPKLGDYYQ
jgi:hypothetical protein